MRSKFPKYEKKTLTPLYKNFNPSDKKLIEDFLIFCGGTAGKTTIQKYRSVLIKICDVFEGDLENIDLKRLRLFLNILNQSDLLPTTKNEIRKVLKRFLKETYDNWSSLFKQLNDIKGEKEINQDKINADTILRKKEIEALIRGADNLKYRAMLILFYETAGRPEEIINLKWNAINLNEGSVKLKSSKTGNVRINPIQESIIHLRRYKQEYPFVDIKADDWVFVSPQNRERHQSLIGVGIYFKRLSTRVLDRPIFPYLIRHTRATELQKVLPAKIYEKFMDHSTETATRYSHLNKDDVRKVMLENVYKIKELSEEKKTELEKKVKKLEESHDLTIKKTESIIKNMIELNQNFRYVKRKKPLTKEQSIKDLNRQ
jgi:integrase